MCELPPNCQGDERCPFVCAKNGTSPPRYPPAVCNIDKGRAEICNDIVNACRTAKAKRMKRTTLMMVTKWGGFMQKAAS